MKKFTFIVFLLTLSLNSFSQIIILNSFPAPTTLCGDLAFDGQYLWIGGQNEYELFQISTIDGSIIKTIPTSIKNPYGLAFDGSFLWVADTQFDSIKKIDPQNGNVISSFPSPKSTPTKLAGLAWDGNNIWCNDFGLFNGNFYNYLYDSTFVLNSSGNTVQGYSSFGQGPTGLGYGNGYLFSADSETDQIYIINPSTYTVLDSFPTVGGTHPNGIAWDGNFLWLANNDNDSIYQIDVNSIISSISEFSDQRIDVTIYPNPSIDFINIVFSRSSNPKFEIFDISGRSVPPSININSSTSYTLNISNLSKGMYFLSINSDNIRTTRVIVKQ